MCISTQRGSHLALHSTKLAQKKELIKGNYISRGHDILVFLKFYYCAKEWIIQRTKKIHISSVQGLGEVTV